VRTVEVLGYLDLVARPLCRLKATEPVLLAFRQRPNNPAHPGSTIQLKLRTDRQRHAD